MSENVNNMAEAYQRNQFTFYVSFMDVAKMMSEEERNAFLNAICEFGLYHQEPDFKSDYEKAKFAWMQTRPNLESQWKHSINGSKGGAPIGSHNNKNGRRGNVSKVIHQQKDSDNTDSKMPDIETRKEALMARKEAFKDEINAILPKLNAEFEEKKNVSISQDTVEEFFIHWTEPNRSWTKMKFELEGTFLPEGRLRTWINYAIKFGKK